MSAPLLQRMLKDPYKITITGTIKKNKREIPAEMKVASKNPLASKFCHTPELTLVSCTPKKNKIVLLLTSYMHTTEITENKPNVVHYYNETNGGTDCFDQLCHSYTVSRRTNRLPVRMFYGMLDQAILNARILLTRKLKASNSREKVSAITCLGKVAIYLMKPHLIERYNTLTLRRDWKIGIADRKTNEGCSNCHNAVCEDHRVTFCQSCSNK